MNRLLRVFVAIPLLTFLWGAANSTGATQSFTQAFGLPNADTWHLPLVGELIRARSSAQSTIEAAAEREALKVVKDQVRAQYGPQVADSIPDGVPLNNLRHLTPADLRTIPRLTRALGLPAGTILHATRLPGAPTLPAGGTIVQAGGPGGAPGPAPFMNTAAYHQALIDLAKIPVKGAAPKTGYSRSQFGPAWTDAAYAWNPATNSIGGKNDKQSDTVTTVEWSHNGCDTRNDMLGRDLVNKTYKAGTGNCKVLSGTLPYDPYSGATNEKFSIINGATSSLDAEHSVALGDAWVTGAAQWSPAKREAYANDPLVLMSVNSHDNRAKGDSDIAAWQPPNKAYRCAYAARQIAVKTKYGLWVTPPEHDTMQSLLKGCGA